MTAPHRYDGRAREEAHGACAPNVAPLTRRDTSHANPALRLSDAQYKRYIWLVERFRSLGWDNMKLHDASPFCVVDPGFNAVLIRSCKDFADLADRLGAPEIADQSRSMATKGIAAMETLWSDAHGQYLCEDRTFGTLIDSPSFGGLLAAFADIPGERAAQLARRTIPSPRSAISWFPAMTPPPQISMNCGIGGVLPG